MLSKKIPIVISFTPNYFIPAITVVKSILNGSNGDYTYHIICLLTEDIPEDMKKDFLLLGPLIQVSFINMKGRLGDIYVDERYTVAASYRLLIPDIIKDYEKVIYIDCDIIVQQNLGQLFNEINLTNYYYAGVFEATLPHQHEYLLEIGCAAGRYINSGFLLVNLDKLKKDNMVDKLLSVSNNSSLEFPDQDAINIVCQGNILGLLPVYNSIRTFYLPQYKNEFLKLYTQKDWEQVQLNGNIHYTGAKPWDHFTVEFEKWWQCYESLPHLIRKKYEFHKHRKMFILFFLYKKLYFKSIISTVRNIFRKFKYN